MTVKSCKRREAVKRLRRKKETARSRKRINKRRKRKRSCYYFIVGRNIPLTFIWISEAVFAIKPLTDEFAFP